MKVFSTFSLNEFTINLLLFFELPQYCVYNVQWNRKTCLILCAKNNFWSTKKFIQIAMKLTPSRYWYFNYYTVAIVKYFFYTPLKSKFVCGCPRNVLLLQQLPSSYSSWTVCFSLNNRNLAVSRYTHVISFFSAPTAAIFILLLCNNCLTGSARETKFLFILIFFARSQTIQYQLKQIKWNDRHIISNAIIQYSNVFIFAIEMLLIHFELNSHSRWLWELISSLMIWFSCLMTHFLSHFFFIFISIFMFFSRKK